MVSHFFIVSHLSMVSYPKVPSYRIFYSNLRKYHNLPLSLHRKINNYNLSLECNESLRIHYSFSLLFDSSLSDSPSKYDSMVFIFLTRISSTESVIDLVDPR